MSRIDGDAGAADGDARRLRGGARPALVVGVGVLMGVLAVADLSEPASPWWWPVIPVAVSVLALAPLVRPGPRARVLATAAVVVSILESVLFAAFRVAEFSVLEMGALVFLLVDRWRVARRPRDWVLVAGTVTAFMAIQLRGLVLYEEFGAYVAYLHVREVVAMLAVVAVAAAVATVLRGQDAHRATAVAAVRRAERAEIARELHDVVAHHVTGIVVATQAARSVTAAEVPPRVDGALAAIEDSGSQALGAMRRLVGVLRTEGTGGTDGTGGGPLRRTPRLADLDELVRRFRDTGAVGDVAFDTLLDHRVPVGPELQAAAHRVVQEALANVACHAFGAARTRVAVTTVTDGVLEIEVTNSAGRAGPDSTTDTATDRPGDGFGLVGVRERVQVLGGHLSAGPLPGGGWAVYATIPLSAPAAAS